MINYNNKVFVPLSNSENGEVDLAMQFIYQQTGNIVTSTYAGGRIRSGHLIGYALSSGERQRRDYDGHLQIDTRATSER
jgi:hypothetical protein